MHFSILTEIWHEGGKKNATMRKKKLKKHRKIKNYIIRENKRPH